MEKDPKILAKSTFREATSFLHRLNEKIRDRFIWTHQEIEEAVGYLIYFRNSLKKENKPLYLQIFGESGEFFDIKHFKRGFNTKSITFKTIVGESMTKWVLKVGHRIALVVDFGDPSTIAYYQQNKKYLEMLRREIKKYPVLKSLLPEPQETIWAVLNQEGNQIGRTLILQPFVKIIKPKTIKKKFVDEQKKELLKELEAFKKLCTYLIDEEKVRPDLWGEGNLEIVESNGEYHLMLLDFGLVNLRAPLPITNTVMEFTSFQTLNYIENLIKKIL